MATTGRVIVDEQGASVAEVTEAAPSPDTRREDVARRYVDTARQRFETARNAEATLRREQTEDARFAAGSINGVSTQWSEDIQRSRAKEKRPCLTINRIPTFIRQVTNSARASRPAISVVPVDRQADPETAEAIYGICRQIEQTSDADVAYQRAADGQARMGRGWFRLAGEYLDDRTDEQGLFVRSVLDQHSIYADPAGVDFTGADLRFLFEFEDVPNDEYRSRYGKDPVTAEDFGDDVTAATDWAPEGKTRVAVYWHVDFVDDTLHIYQDGSTRFASEGGRPEDAGWVRSRTLRRKQVRYARINGVEVLEGNDDLTGGRDWPGTRIPYFPVIGEELYVDGQRDYHGVVRDARDPARTYNYWVTAQTEQIALAPRAPYILDYRSIAAYKAFWDVANTANLPYLPYDSTDPNDPQRAYPAPQRNFGDPSGIQATAVAIRQADNDLKSTGGFFDASLGQAGPQESGRAILARQQQDSIGSSHYLDNLGKAIRACGREIVALIPHFYDTPRVMRILGLDDKPKLVLTHAGADMAPDEALQAQAANLKIQRAFDLSVGRYDVVIASGPSYANQAERDNEVIGKLLQAAPQLAPLVADIVVDNTSFRGKDKIVSRLQKQMGPLAGEDGAQPSIPPEVQAHIQQLEGRLAEMSAALQQAESGLAGKQLDAASRERVAAINAASDERVAALRAETDLQIAALRADLQRITQVMGLTADAEARREGQAHAVAMRGAFGGSQIPPVRGDAGAQ